MHNTDGVVLFRYANDYKIIGTNRVQLLLPIQHSLLWTKPIVEFSWSLSTSKGKLSGEIYHQQVRPSPPFSLSSSLSQNDSLHGALLGPAGELSLANELMISGQEDKDSSHPADLQQVSSVSSLPAGWICHFARARSIQPPGGEKSGGHLKNWQPKKTNPTGMIDVCPPSRKAN